VGALRRSVLCRANTACYGLVVDVFEETEFFSVSVFRFIDRLGGAT
jgi:hypothetical protein